MASPELEFKSEHEIKSEPEYESKPEYKSELEYASVEEMDTVFNKKLSLVRTSIEYRKMCEDSARHLRSVEGKGADLKELYTEIREEISKGEGQLVKLETLLANIEVLNQKLDHIQQNLPPAIKKEIKEEKPVSSDVVKEPVAQSKSSANPKKLQCITLAEFKGVSDYMKGRMKYEQVNKFVSDFNGAVEGKYKVLSLPRKEMKPAVFKVYQKLKLQENADTKGIYFCTADDLKEYGKIKLDKGSNNILTILRHCKKLKEIRGPGPIVRYAIIP